MADEQTPIATIASPQITGFGCSGYKAFEHPVDLPVAGLTVLFGKNNSGKTSLLRLPLVVTDLLYSALTKGEDTSRRTQELFRRHVNTNAAHPSMSVSVSWSDETSVTAEFLLVASARSGSHIVLNRLDLGAAGISTAPPDAAESDLPGFLTGETLASATVVATRCRDMLSGVMHIASARPALAEVYADRDAREWSVDEAPYLLKQHDGLLAATATWFDECYEGLSLDVDPGGAFAFRVLAGGSRRGPVNAADSGRGTQSVLPVATLLTAVSLGMTTPSLVLLEEPEAHLHPSVHGSIAHLLLPAAARVPVIVETHSEHLLLRLRREIARGLVDPAQVHLAFVDADNSIVPISVDKYGGVANWPEGVFEYDILDAEQIIEARLTANPESREP